MKEKVRALLQSDKVDVVLGYRMRDGHALPHFFTKDKIHEVDELATESDRYPLETMAVDLATENPKMKIGLILRDCNRRALNILCIWNQIDPANIEILDVGCCPSGLKQNAHCSYLNPEKPGAYKLQNGLDHRMTVEDYETYDQQERFQRWMYEFEKCIKCYGCRNICPVCFCQECSLEHPELVGNGGWPHDVPLFHLVRAVHMAGRCVDCGLCEEACPVDIPLRLLYRKVNDIVVEIFDYETGTSRCQSPFNILGEEVVLEPKPMCA